MKRLFFLVSLCFCSLYGMKSTEAFLKVPASKLPFNPFVPRVVKHSAENVFVSRSSSVGRVLIPTCVGAFSALKGTSLFYKRQPREPEKQGLLSGFLSMCYGTGVPIAVTPKVRECLQRWDTTNLSEIKLATMNIDKTIDRTKLVNMHPIISEMCVLEVESDELPLPTPVEDLNPEKESISSAPLPPALTTTNLPPATPVPLPETVQQQRPPFLPTAQAFAEQATKLKKVEEKFSLQHLKKRIAELKAKKVFTDEDQKEVDRLEKLLINELEEKQDKSSSEMTELGMLKALHRPEIVQQRERYEEAQKAQDEVALSEGTSTSPSEWED